MNAALVEMRHEQSQAKLCWLDNKEENRFFSVGFQTLPEDDTGVFHILEHSVLCGSARYPLKEPFVELLKSSMNTFLNAMTYPDKTVYPVASRNAQDFLNLVSVYLDAVFAPLLRENSYIFIRKAGIWKQRGCTVLPRRRLQRDEGRIQRPAAAHGRKADGAFVSG